MSIRWDPVAGALMSPADDRIVAVIGQAIRDSGFRHGTGCIRFCESEGPCTCQWERSSLTMARNIVKAIVEHYVTRPS